LLKASALVWISTTPRCEGRIAPAARREQGKAADDAGVEDLPEGTDAVRQHDAVDAIIECCRASLRTCSSPLRPNPARRRDLQQHLVQRRIVSLRQCFDRLMVD